MKLIKTENYLFVIDDSEIKEGDYRVNIQRGYIQLVDDNPEYYNKRNDVFKKVLAHLPLNNSPILRDVDLLPPLEEEPTEEAKQRAKNYMSLKGALEPKPKPTEEAKKRTIPRISKNKTMIDKEFAPYEQALALKELGFDEPCFGYYSNGNLVYGNHTNNMMQRFRYAAPTFSQAFRFFREKYKIRFIIQSSMSDLGEFFKVIFPNGEQRGVSYKTYEEAELACLKKLIEIVKNK